jgi:hypothetical protein
LHEPGPKPRVYGKKEVWARLGILKIKRKHYFQQMPFFCSPENQKKNVRSDQISWKVLTSPIPGIPVLGLNIRLSCLVVSLNFRLFVPSNSQGLEMGANCSSRPKKMDVGMDLWNEIFQTIHQDFCEIFGIIKKWVQSSRGFYGKNV